MKSGDTSTHRPQAVNPADFKAQATGIGQTLAHRLAPPARARHSASPAARRRPATGLPDQGQRRLLSAPAAPPRPHAMTGPGPNNHKQGWHGPRPKGFRT